MSSPILRRAGKLLVDLPHPRRSYLVQILTGRTSLSSTGFPYISERSFKLFLEHVPHLFTHGNALLTWLKNAEKKMEQAKGFSKSEQDSFLSAVRVLRTIVYSAAVCAPSDLWILKHVLSAHSQFGLTKVIADEKRIDPEKLSNKMMLDQNQLSWDLSLFHCRGYLIAKRKTYHIADIPQAHDVFRNTIPIPPEFLRDMVEPMLEILSGGKITSETLDLVSSFLKYSVPQGKTTGWVASRFELETSYRLVPLILSLHATKALKGMDEGSNVFQALPKITPEMKTLLVNAGIIQSKGKLTALGARVIQRGPGPFGIIHAYVPYMQVLADRLSGKATKTWVQRGKNIAASQDANRKTFEMANDTYDRFCKDHNLQCSVFIEHALGQGEATRQRLDRSGEQNIQYFGADLEDAAIDKAEDLQRKNILPKNMIFIRKADIANPDIVIDAVRTSGHSTESAVMFVGNGFHEVRSQTNQKIVEVFRKYCAAGIVVIFTEESALNDYDLMHTGWNTYHAGFRYVHELSGQGLRPVFGTDHYGRHSWKICAALGGFAVLSKYSVHTRTIYPFPKHGGYNPPISMTYFCVPSSLAQNLGYFPRSWSQT